MSIFPSRKKEETSAEKDMNLLFCIGIGIIIFVAISIFLFFR